MLWKNCYNFLSIMPAYLRAKTVITLIICVAAVGGVAAYVYGDFWGPKNLEKTAGTAAISGSSHTINDLVETAGWKETFYNVTDEDIKGFEIHGAQNISTLSVDEDLTATDIFGREFFSKYLMVRQTGMVSDPNTTQALVDQVLQDSALVTDTPRVYTQNDLTINIQEDDASREAYAHTVAHILINDRPTENEALIAKEALTNGDLERLADIDPIIATYASIRSDLLHTPVPASLADYHLDLVNGVSEALANAVALRNAGTDPLQSLNAVARYPGTESKIFYTILDLRTYFNEYGITFETGEEAFRVFSMK
jgi:hypothetical protein